MNADSYAGLMLLGVIVLAIGLSIFQGIKQTQKDDEDKNG